MKIAILGYGVVGSGVVEVIEKNRAMVGKKAGEDLEVKYILDIRDFPGDAHEAKIVKDFTIILDDPEVEIICETMGGATFALDFTRRALSKGKSVCTSNKELVAAHGPELLALAREHKCNYLFEASVGGGIPIIRPLNYSLTAEKIEGITGILNGTTNYILSHMEAHGTDFAQVLADAQALGYAEKDPTADVDGHDACRKIAILSSLMVGENVDYASIPTEGIRQITAADFAYAKAWGGTIKLLAKSRLGEDGRLEALVAPHFVAAGHPLYPVGDVFNAVMVRGNMLGDSMYYGRGAGKLPTASAVVSDVIDCARHRGKTIMCFWESQAYPLRPAEELESAYFLRIEAGAQEAVREAFGQLEWIEAPGRQDRGCITVPMAEAELSAKARELEGVLLSRIRIESI